MVLVLQNEGLDENNEHNIDMAKFDDIVYDLLEVKKYLENPMVKEVFVVPDEYLPTENAFDFNPTKAAHDNQSDENVPLQNRKRKNLTGMPYHSILNYSFWLDSNWVSIRFTVPENQQNR